MCAIGAILYIHRGVTEMIEYDGYWHIWVAAQNDWHLFSAEYQMTSHPPLFFLLLKLIMSFWRTTLAFRAVSILAGIGAVFVVGKTAAAITRSRETAVLAAVLFGLSTPVVSLATEVRSYMLALFWITAAFYQYIRIWQTQGASRRVIAWFTVFSAFALLSHYYTAFFLLACALAPLYLTIVNKDARAAIVTTLRRDSAALALSFAVLCATGAYLYYQQARTWATFLNHLPQFYYQKNLESIPVFLWRTTRALLESFLPFSIAANAVYIVCLLILAAAITYAIYHFHVHARAGLAGAFPLAFLMILVVALAVAAILDKYPYGGAMRQQSVVLPFAVLSTVLVVRNIAGANRKAFAATLAAVTAVCLYSESTHDYRPLDAPLHSASFFRSNFPAPDAVFTDRYSFLFYYMGEIDREWSYLNAHLATLAYRPDGSGLVFRNFRWNFDFADPAVYTDMRDLLRVYGVRSITMFCKRQSPFLGDAAAVARTNSAAAGLVIDKIRMDGPDLYATFVPETPPVQSASK